MLQDSVTLDNPFEIQLMECLPNMHKAMASFPSATRAGCGDPCL